MHNIKKTLGILTVLATSALLAGCLPEDKDPNAIVLAAEESSGNSGYYGVALSNLAMQIQNAIVTDSSWFDTLGAGQNLDLAAMGVSTQSIAAPVKAVACPDASGNGVLQMVWINSADDKGAFSLKSVGFNLSSMVDSLKTRIAGSQLGLYKGQNSLALMDNTTLNIPAGCSGLQSIPTGAPVIAIKIDRPAAPTVATSRTEFRTVDCPAVAGVEQTGTKIQRRVVTYKPDGTMHVVDSGGAELPFGPNVGWRDESIGKCISIVDVNVAVSEDTSKLGSALDQFAAINLKNILDNRIRNIDCSRSTVTSGEDGTSINTCVDNLVVDSSRVIEEGGIGSGEEVRIISCTGNTSVTGVPSFGGTTGNSTTASVWGGTSTLVRVRNNTQLKAINTNQQVTIGQWVGREPNGAACLGTENTGVSCNQVADRPTIVTPSPTKWISVTSDAARSFRGTQGRNSGCSGGSAGTAPDCADMSIISLTYLNPAFFHGTSLVNNGGINIRNRVDATQWADRVAFKPRITARSSYTITSNQCEWHSKVMYDTCPTPATVTEAGTWNASTAPVTETALATYQNTSPTLRFQDSFNGASLNTTNLNAGLPIAAQGGTGMYEFLNNNLRQVVNLFNQYRAAGHIVSNASRSYSRHISGNKGGYWSSSGSINVGQGSNLYYRSWQTGGSVHVNNRLVLNATAMAYRQAMCNAGYATGAYAALCSADQYMDVGNRMALTRDLCRMFNIRWQTAHYSPGLSGQLRTYCEYIFEEWAYDHGMNRSYRYPFREMADNNQRFATTTVLNQNGVVTRMQPTLSQTQIGTVPPAFTARVNVGITGYVTPLHCARQEADLVEVPLTIHYKSYWSFAPNPPTLRSSTGRRSYWHGGVSGIGMQLNEFHNFNSTAVLRRTAVREYRSDIGWSRPRYVYTSPYYGTFSSLPSRINYDIPRSVIGNDCHGGSEGACFSLQDRMSTRR